MDMVQFQAAAEGLGVRLSAEQLDSFQTFEDNLYKANEVMNLTRVPKEEAWLRHFLDSLLLQWLIPQGASVLDLGTGPGFPSWPLARARPDLTVTALDSSGKMLGFLRKNPLTNLEVVQARAEEWGRRDAFDFVTGRALAPLAIQLELSAPTAKLNALVVPMRTPNDLDSISALDTRSLGLHLEEIKSAELPGTDIKRVFPIYRKVAKTPTKFPRPWAEIKRQPFGT